MGGNLATHHARRRARLNGPVAPWSASPPSSTPSSSSRSGRTGTRLRTWTPATRWSSADSSWPRQWWPERSGTRGRRSRRCTPCSPGRRLPTGGSTSRSSASTPGGRSPARRSPSARAIGSALVRWCCSTRTSPTSSATREHRAGLSTPTPGSDSGQWDVSIVGGVDLSDPDEVGPSELDVWTRFDGAPDDRIVDQALLAFATDGFLIGTAMRPHKGVGQAQAHVSISTGVLSHTLTFHEPLRASSGCCCRTTAPMRGTAAATAAPRCSGGRRARGVVRPGCDDPGHATARASWHGIRHALSPPTPRGAAGRSGGRRARA